VGQHASIDSNCQLTVPVTWLLIAITLILAFYEIASFSTEDLVEVVSVDSTHEDDMMVYLDVAFPDMDCYDTSLDVLDMMGNPPKTSLQKIEYTPYLPEYRTTILCRTCKLTTRFLSTT
jgi:hypothetical protein